MVAAQSHPNRLASSDARPLKALAVIDGSERTGRVVDYALRLARQGPLETVLLAVVRQPPDGRLRGYGSFKRDEINARLKDVIGQRAVSTAARRFDQAGVSHKDRIEVADPVETILRVAREEACEIVVVPGDRANALQRWLSKATGLSLATVAGQIAQSAEMPVVVVK
jgi:nucleotide-binding universal stress UspA family protein